MKYICFFNFFFENGKEKWFSMSLTIQENKKLKKYFVNYILETYTCKNMSVQVNYNCRNLVIFHPVIILARTAPAHAPCSAACSRGLLWSACCAPARASCSSGLQ